MKPIYSEITDPITGEITILADLGDGRFLSIPTDPANSDYQRYLKWVENPNAEETNYLTPPATIELTQPDEADLTEGNN